MKMVSNPGDVQLMVSYYCDACGKSHECTDGLFSFIYSDMHICYSCVLEKLLPKIFVAKREVLDGFELNKRIKDFAIQWDIEWDNKEQNPSIHLLTDMVYALGLNMEIKLEDLLPEEKEKTKPPKR